MSFAVVVWFFLTDNRSTIGLYRVTLACGHWVHNILHSTFSCTGSYGSSLNVSGGVEGGFRVLVAGMKFKFLVSLSQWDKEAINVTQTYYYYTY